MSRTVLAIAVAVVVMVALSAPAVQAQQPNPPAKPKSEKPPGAKEKPAEKPKPGEKTGKALSAADKQFMTEAATGGLLEVRLGELARKQATSEDVKRFGERMVTDHSKLNDELKALASKTKVELPKELTQKQQATVDQLAKLKGAEFDREYMNSMVTDHTADVSAFQKQVKDGKDREVKAWAQKALPILEAHLKLAKEVKGKLG